MLRTGHILPLITGRPLGLTRGQGKGDIEKELRLLSVQEHVGMTEDLQKKRGLLLKVLYLRDELTKSSGAS